MDPTRDVRTDTARSVRAKDQSDYLTEERTDVRQDVRAYHVPKVVAVARTDLMLVVRL